MERSPRPPARRCRLAAGVGLVAAWGCVASAGAQGGASGAELQVNSYTTSTQARPRVALDEAGDFVVVWQSLGSSGTDLEGLSVQGRRFSAAGVPQGGDFQVNTVTYEYQAGPEVVMGPAGEFVVAWRSSYLFTPWAYYDLVAVQRFDAAGVPAGGEITAGGRVVRPPGLARDGAGNFVVAWSTASGVWNYDPYWRVSGGRFDAEGQLLSSFAVDFDDDEPLEDPAVAADGPGDFVVAWSGQASGGPDLDWGVEAQRYDTNGFPQGSAFQVNVETVQVQNAPAVAMDPTGGFVVVWQSQRSNGGDLSGWSIHARRFAADGTPLSGDLQVNTLTSGNQQRPRVASDALGNFLVVWQSDVSGSTDTSGTSIQARWFDADGSPLGAEFQVNTYTTGAQAEPSVAVRDLDNFVVVWQSDGSSGNDHDSSSIHAQRFGIPFLDGFEAGDTARWTATVP
jgi:hypothetical protein